MTANPTFFLACDETLCVREYADQGYASTLEETRAMAAGHGWTLEENGDDICGRCNERRQDARERAERRSVR